MGGGRGARSCLKSSGIIPSEDFPEPVCNYMYMYSNENRRHAKVSKSMWLACSFISVVWECDSGSHKITRYHPPNHSKRGITHLASLITK